MHVVGLVNPYIYRDCKEVVSVLPEDYDLVAHKVLVSMQTDDVHRTYADVTAVERDFKFTPKITLREGLRKFAEFAEWYQAYRKYNYTR